MSISRKVQRASLAFWVFCGSQMPVYADITVLNADVRDVDTGAVTPLLSSTADQNFPNESELLINAGSVAVENGTQLSLHGEIFAGDGDIGALILNTGGRLTVNDVGTAAPIPRLVYGIVVGRSPLDNSPGSAQMSISNAGTEVNVTASQPGNLAYVALGLTEGSPIATYGSGTVTSILDVTDGALLSIRGVGTTNDALLSVGSGAFSSATMNMDGIGTRVEVVGSSTARVVVASDLGSNLVTGPAQGALNLTNGAVLDVAGPVGGVLMGIGIGAGDGQVSVASGSSISVAGDLYVSTPNPVDATANNDTTGVLEILGGTSRVDVAGAALFGNAGTLSGDGTFTAGSLTVANGGLIDFTGFLDVGGAVTVDGGFAITGTDGFVSAGEMILASEATAGANMVVDDQAGVSILGTLVVGDAGTASLVIGGAVGATAGVFADTLVIGKQSGADGSVTLTSDPTGSVSLLTAQLRVAAAAGATGSLIVSNGAALDVGLSASTTIPTEMMVGVGAGSDALVVLDAGSASLVGELTRILIGSDDLIGQGPGHGSVVLQNGSVMSLFSNSAAESLIVIGDGGEGALSVGGASSLSMNGEIWIGAGGQGTLVVDTGSSVSLDDFGSIPSSVEGVGIAVGESRAADNADGSGSLTVTGANTSVDIQASSTGRFAYLDVGHSEGILGSGSAQGTVTVADGARLTLQSTGGDAFLSVGSGANSTASMLIDGSNTLVQVDGVNSIVGVGSDAGFSTVTGPAQSTLQISNGARLEVGLGATTASSGYFGIGIGTGDGQVTVSGGAEVEVNGSLQISVPNTVIPTTNNDTTGVLTILDTSSVLIAGDALIGDAGQLVGDGNFSANTLTVQSGGEVDFDGDLSVADLVVDGGSVTVGGQLAVTAADTLSVINGGAFVLNGTTTSLSNEFGAGAFFGGTGLLDGNVLMSTGSFNAFAGNVTGTVVNQGGTYAPNGSAAGTVFVGSYVQQTGLLELTLGGSNLGEYDLINADGDIDLQGGAVALEFINGFGPAGAEGLIVLSANNGGALTIDPSVAYNVGSGQTAFQLLPDVFVGEGGTSQVARLNFLELNLAEQSELLTTPNMASLAESFDETCTVMQGVEGATDDEQDLINVCTDVRNAGNTPEQLTQALAALDTTETTQTVNSLLVFTIPQHGNLSQRVNAIRNGANPFDFSGLNVVLDDHQIAGADLEKFLHSLVGGIAGADDFDRWGAFVNANINYGEKDATANGAGFDFDTILFTLGIDYRLRDHWVIGGSLSYADVRSDFNEGGGMDLQSWAAGVFGTYFKENYYVDVLYTYGSNDIETDRRIAFDTVLGGVNRRATADTDGDQHTFSLGAGYDVTQQAWVFGPHVGINYTALEVDRYTETGASGLNLSVDRQEATSFTANLGLHASRTFTPEWGVITPYFRADWVHEFKDDAETVEVAFANDRFTNDPANPTSPIRVETDQRDSNYLVYSVGASVQMIRGISGFLNYRTTQNLDDMDLSDITWGLRFEYDW